MFIKRLHLRYDNVLIFLSIKLFFTSIRKQGSGLENKAVTENEPLEDSAIDQLLEELQRKVARDFRFQMADYHQRENLLKELQVRIASFIIISHKKCLFNFKCGSSVDCWFIKCRGKDLAIVLFNWKCDKHDNIVDSFLRALVTLGFPNLSPCILWNFLDIETILTSKC